MTVTNFLVACSHDLIWRFIFHNFGFCFRRKNFLSPKGGGIERLKRHDQHPPKIPINTIHPKFSNGSSPKGHSTSKLAYQVSWVTTVLLSELCAAVLCRCRRCCSKTSSAHGAFQSQSPKGALGGPGWYDMSDMSHEVDLHHEVEHLLKKPEPRRKAKAKATANLYNHKH